MELRRVLARNVVRRRNALSYSQEEVAHLAGIDRTWVSTLENAKAAVSIDVIEGVARALGVDLSELLRCDLD